ncbi:MAG: hypothetical protein ACRD4Q_00135 [Candidatus Acidiferrales bacterium]
MSEARKRALKRPVLGSYKARRAKLRRIERYAVAGALPLVPMGVSDRVLRDIRATMYEALFRLRTE